MPSQQIRCMISTRLQQTLNSRIQLIESLLLIYSYSELVNVRVDSYRRENERIHEKEIILLETYRNIFKMDQNFRKLFYNLIVKIFNRLSSKFKAKPPPKNIKISSAYYQFLIFFKNANEFEIIRYLQRLDIDSLPQNHLFCMLTSTLIRYTKAKTDAIILKLKEKCKKEDLNFYQGSSIQLIQCVQQSSRRRKDLQKRRVLNFSRKKISTPSLSTHKCSSQQNKKPLVLSSRRYSKQLSKVSTFQTECKELCVKEVNNITWKPSFKRFKEIYARQWETYFRLLGPLTQELEENKRQIGQIDIQQKKSWISEHFNGIFKDALQRNQLISRHFKNHRERSNSVEIMGKIVKKSRK